MGRRPAAGLRSASAVLVVATVLVVLAVVGPLGSGATTTAAAAPSGGERMAVDHPARSAAPPACAHRLRQRTADVVYHHPVPAGAAADRVALDIHHPVVDPTCPAAPVLVWVHGGGWHTGDKANQLHRKVELATTYGWVLVSVNYRLSPAVTWPTHNDDVAAALHWVRENIGGWGGDPDRLAVMGHSAGAGILAGVLADPRHLEPWSSAAADVACAVLLDTEAYDVAAAAGNPARPQLAATYQSAFGTDPQVWVDASPLTHVGSVPAPPTLVVVGDREPRRTVNAAYVEALRATGTAADLLVVPLAHAAINAAVGDPADPWVNPAVTRWLVGCLGPSFVDVPPGHPFFDPIEALAGTGAVSGFADLTYRPTHPVSRQAMAAVLARLDHLDPPNAGTDGFADVTPGHPFAAEISAVAASGLVAGDADGSFRPTAPLSRQAAAVILWRRAGSPSATGPATFPDTPTIEPFHTALVWAAEAQVLQGYADGTVRPTASVSRQALAAMVARSPTTD